MKAQEIHKGDQFWMDGELRYTVTKDAEVHPHGVLVPIRWEDSQGGGLDVRVWDLDAEAHLTRPV